MIDMKSTWERTARSLEKELVEVRKGMVEVLETRVCKTCGAVETDINWKQLCYRLIEIINIKPPIDLDREPPMEAPPEEKIDDDTCGCGYCDYEDLGDSTR